MNRFLWQLYGTKWNTAMPRFAANLGGSPLQPVKSGVASENETTDIADVPVAQFDWTSSGLVNPLDGNLSLYLVACSLSINHRLRGHSSSLIKIEFRYSLHTNGNHQNGFAKLLFNRIGRHICYDYGSEIRE